MEIRAEFPSLADSHEAGLFCLGRRATLAPLFMSESRLLRPSTALAAYGEPLIEGRRVLVFGEATSSLAENLLERGARAVHVCDRDPGRVAEASTRNTSRNVSFAPLGDGGLAMRDGAFDVAIVENLAAVGDVSLGLSSIKRALSARGVALIACANPDVEVTLIEAARAPKITIDYYSLYDAVAEEFEYVRMLGQTPFVGYAIADFAPDADPLPALDTGCVPGGAEEPEWFIALASHRALLLDEFAIIQLPFSSTWRRSGSDEVDAMLRAARSAERRARQRVAALEVENRRLTRGMAKSEASEDIERLEKDLKSRADLIEELEARCTAADARADEIQRQLDEYLEAQPRSDDSKAGRPAEEQREEDLQAAQRLADLERQVKQLNGDLEEAEQRSQAAEEASKRSREALEQTRHREVELRRTLEAGDSEPERDIAHLEAQLAERGREVLRLQRDLSKTETMAKNLLQELEELNESQAGSGQSRRDLELQLDELAQRNAAREADLVALRWTLAQLSGTPLAPGAAEKGSE